MKQSLPWNVTGIPPEAREAARAAASREGLSVGDWLTRRIYSESGLRPSPEPRRELPADPFLADPFARSDPFARPDPFAGARERAPELRPSVDSETRRDHERLLQHLTRSEVETEAAFRRIEETLKVLNRRIEAAERAHSEAERSMAAAAAEINSASRDQSQTFHHLAQRIDTVERQSDNSALRDAMRGLHQGLSRLTDQNTKTATETLAQVNTLAGSIVSTRDDATRAAQDLAAKIQAGRDEAARLVNELSAKFASAQEETNHLVRGLGGEIAATRDETNRVTGDFEARLNGFAERLARTEDLLSTSEERVGHRLGGVEERVQETLSNHLASIERTLGNVSAQLEKNEQRVGHARNAADSAVQALVARFEESEKSQRENLSGVRATLAELKKRFDTLENPAPMPEPMDVALAGPIDVALVHAEPIAERFVAPGLDARLRYDDVPQAEEEEDAPQAEDYDEVSDSAEDDVLEQPSDELEEKDEADDAPPPVFTSSPDLVSEDDEPPPALLSPAETAFESEPSPAAEAELEEQAPASAAAETAHADSAQRSTPLDYISAARRAAQAAAQAETQRKGRHAFTPARMDRAQSEAQGDEKKRRLSPAMMVAGLVVLAGVAGILVIRQMSSPPDAEIAASNPEPLPPVLAPVQAPEIPANQPPAAQSAPAIPLPPTVPLTTAPTGNAPGVVAPGVVTPAPRASTVPQANTAATIMDRVVAGARAGSARAALLAGLKYLDGDGVPVNDAEGVRWMRAAADKGEPLAQYRLGTLYERGRGVPTDMKQAVSWYDQAAKGGNSKAMRNLAVAYADGNGIEKNFAEAARWFKSAAELGLVDSQFNLAVLYERGMGVAPSLTEAYRWYLLAGAQGDAESKTRVEALATQLQPAQRETIQRAADAFRPRPMVAAANNPPTVAQVAP